MFRKWGFGLIVLIGLLAAAPAAIARGHVSVGIHGPGYGVHWSDCRHCGSGYHARYFGGYYPPDYYADYYPAYRPVVYHPVHRPVYHPAYRPYYRDRYYDRDRDYRRRDRDYHH